MQVRKFVKQPVAVNVTIETNGKVHPRKFLWKDGHWYKIDRVTLAERAASTKVGGCGIRYTIMVEGMPRFLYDEDGKWFMEDEVIIEVAG
jgi:hypothetical protein